MRPGPGGNSHCECSLLGNHHKTVREGRGWRHPSAASRSAKASLLVNHRQLGPDAPPSTITLARFFSFNSSSFVYFRIINKHGNMEIFKNSKVGTYNKFPHTCQPVSTIMYLRPVSFFLYLPPFPSLLIIWK